MLQIEQITSLMKTEELERKENNLVKSLEVCIKILDIYLKENEYMALFDVMNELSFKPSQSHLSIFGILRYSIKIIYPKISKLPELMSIYLTTINTIISNITFANESQKKNQSHILKILKDKPINVKQLFEAINNFEYNESELNHAHSLIKISHSTVNIHNSSKGGNTSSKTLNNGNLWNSTTNINISKLKNDTILFKKQTIKLPYILFCLEITLSNTQLKQTLIDNMIKLNTQLKENINDNVFTIIQKDNNIIRNICQIMFPKSNESTVIKCSIKNTTNRYDRLVELKGVSGTPYGIETLISSFVKRLIKISKNITIMRHTDNYFIQLKDEIKKEFESQNREVYNTLSLYDENSSIIDTINKEAANYYEIYRIISQENYDLGKSVALFINAFKEDNRQMDKAIIRVPFQMKEILSMTESCVGTFNNYFNFGKSNTEKLLKCCRPAVEKFIFNKVYYLLYNIYDNKYEKENKLFLERQSYIRNNLTLNEVMAYLEIQTQYRCLDDYKENSMYNFLPYKSTIDCVNKMEYEQCPKDKFDTLINAGLDLRNTILGVNSGLIDLNSMDDELPIFIYITTRLNIKNIFAELHLVEDYLKFSISEDKESKVLTNLMSSMLYISNGWDLKEKK